MTGFMTILAGLAVFILVWLICREITCWYFKINKMLEVQREALAELKKINARGGSDG